MLVARRFPLGAELVSPRTCHFRVWAPKRRRVEVIIDDQSVDLLSEAGGYYAGVAEAKPGTLYRFRLDGDPYLFPDPASRFQPEGPHGPSMVVDPSAFRWSDDGWNGVAIQGAVISEIHIGTFTPEGTWNAAASKLDHLKDVGITVVELMPVADFPGRFGWGYDGVNLFAPTRLYGTPDEFRRFVDRAHVLGIGVILDVVYNHIGPDGNYLGQFSADYVSRRHHTDWGDAINFDGDHCGSVREFFTTNADYWIREFRLDGLRLDATHQVFDTSGEHILAEVTKRVRQAAGGRDTIIVAENELQQSEQARPAEQGGIGMDGLWNDDFHHSAVAALTGRSEAYYSDHRGSPQEFISALKYGFLFQGQHHGWHGKRRGTPALDLPPAHFVNFIENHDQIANTGHGLRMGQRTSPGRLRAMTAVVLLAPSTPMLFQGQEFASSRPFFFFADHHPELASLVEAGRVKFMGVFPSLIEPQPSPHDITAFGRSKLDWSERDRNAIALTFHGDLLRLRRGDPVFGAQRPRMLDGAVLGAMSFVLRFFADDRQDRLLLVNLGEELILHSAPEPLLAPPVGMKWVTHLSTEDARYGGPGCLSPEIDDRCIIPAEAALVMLPASAGNPKT